jgi:hypothetical protein
MGSGSNFDNVLVIDAAGRITPTGALVLAANEKVSRLHAWVIQMNPDGTSAACVASQQAGSFQSTTQWAARDDAVHEGRFRPGQALALAVSISRDADTPEADPIVYWWSETVRVKRQEDAKVAPVIGPVPGGDWRGRLAGALEEVVRLLRSGADGSGGSTRGW